MARKGIVAWLITWQSAGDHVVVDQKVASILNPRLSGGEVRKRVEQLYADSKYSPYERLEYVKKPGENPYPAEFVSLRRVRFEGRITCGHNPYLLARKVNELRVVTDEEGRETLEWKERPLPEFHE